MYRRLALITSLFGLVACGSGASGTAVDRSDAADVAEDATIEPDVTEDTGPDTAPDTAPEVTPDVDDRAALGAPCETDGDCASDLCLDLAAGAGGGVCAQPCVDDGGCPRDFDCVLLAEGGADVQRVCLPNDLCVDPDDDGHGVGPGCRGRDCDETNGAVNASADELCDGEDNDCDGVVDDNPIDAGEDCDTGFSGVCAAGRTMCNDGVLECEMRAASSAEVCDNLDNDCDGATDEGDDGGPLRRPCYDGDETLIGVGACAYGAQTCSAGGYSACIGQVLATGETCDGADNDCDGDTDEGLAFADFYPDRDTDTFGDASAPPTNACARPAGFVENAGDCDDDNPDIRPGAGEIPGDGVDQNCDGTEFCFADSDDDGYRTEGAGVVVSLDEDCDDLGEATAATPTGDCEDDDGTAFPGNPETCDRVDNDCDRRVDEAAFCYAVGEACVDPEDCATALCEAAVCVAPITCVEDGSCPQRIAQSAGGRRVFSERFVLEVSGPSGPASPSLDSERFRLVVGPNPYVTDP